MVFARGGRVGGRGDAGQWYRLSVPSPGDLTHSAGLWLAVLCCTVESCPEDKASVFSPPPRPPPPAQHSGDCVRKDVLIFLWQTFCCIAVYQPSQCTPYTYPVLYVNHSSVKLDKKRWIITSAGKNVEELKLSQVCGDNVK